jgi:preprotein translocase subunit SecG
MQLILTVLHLMLAIGLIGLILIQHGRGADAGAAFGSGASSTVFGAQGSGSFLTRSTAIIATLFFLTSMALAYFAAQVGEPGGLMDNVEVPAPIVIDTNDMPSTDLPPGPVSELAPDDAGPSVNDMPAVDAPTSAPVSTSPADEPLPPAPDATPPAADNAPGDATGAGDQPGNN